MVVSETLFHPAPAACLLVIPYIGDIILVRRPAASGIATPLDADTIAGAASPVSAGLVYLH